MSQLHTGYRSAQQALDERAKTQPKISTPKTINAKRRG